MPLLVRTFMSTHVEGISGTKLVLPETQEC